MRFDGTLSNFESRRIAQKYLPAPLAFVTDTVSLGISFQLFYYIALSFSIYNDEVFFFVIFTIEFDYIPRFLLHVAALLQPILYRLLIDKARQFDFQIDRIDVICNCSFRSLSLTILYFQQLAFTHISCFYFRFFCFTQIFLLIFLNFVEQISIRQLFTINHHLLHLIQLLYQ